MTRRLPRRRPPPVLEMTSAGSFSSGCGAGGSSTGSSIGVSSFSGSSSSLLSSIMRFSSSWRSFLVLPTAALSSLGAGSAAESSSPSSESACISESSAGAAASGLALACFFGIEAALAKDCIMPPDAPRFAAAFFAPPCPEGVGVDSLEEGFCLAFCSSLTCCAGVGLVEAGLAIDGFASGCFVMGAGLGAAPRRSLRRT